MIGRYVLATAAVVLLVVGLLLGAVVYLGLHYGEAADSRVRIGTLAEALIPTADGLQLDPARTPADWLQGYAWAMVLDDDGSVIWQHDLPQNLNKHYTASEIASFSRWYLDDWPVFCWTAEHRPVCGRHAARFGLEVQYLQQCAAYERHGSGYAARAGAAAGCASCMLSAVQLARCAALADDCRRTGHRSRWRYDPAADRRFCGGAGRHGQPHE